MTSNNKIWKTESDKIDAMLSDLPTSHEKEAFLKSKVDLFVGLESGEYSNFKSEVVDHLISAIGDDPSLETKDDFLKDYYRILIDDFGGAKGIKKLAAKKLKLESNMVHKSFYRWSMKFAGLHVLIAGALIALLSLVVNKNVILFSLYPICFVIGAILAIYSQRYFNEIKTQRVLKYQPIYSFEMRNLMLPGFTAVAFAASVFQSTDENFLFYPITILTVIITYIAVLYFFFLKEKIEESSNRLFAS